MYLYMYIYIYNVFDYNVRFMHEEDPGDNTDCHLKFNT